MCRSLFHSAKANSLNSITDDIMLTQFVVGICEKNKQAYDLSPSFFLPSKNGIFDVDGVLLEELRSQTNMVTFTLK